MSGQVKCNVKVLSDIEEKKEIAIQLLLDSYGVCSALRNEEGVIVDFLIEYVNDTVCLLEDLNVTNYNGRCLMEACAEFRKSGLLYEFSHVVSTGIPFAKKIFLYEETLQVNKIKSAFDLRCVKLNDGIAVTWRRIPYEIIKEEAEKYDKKSTELDEELRRLATIVEFSEDAIIGNTLDGYITNWNRGAERIYGFTAEEAKGKHISIMAPTGKELEMESILHRIRQGMHINHYETIRRRKDGMLLEVSITASPIFDNNGRIIGGSAIARDITARKQLERTLVESEERYRMLIDFLPFGIFVHQEGRIVFVNDFGVKLLGASNINDLLGKGLKDFKFKENNQLSEDHKGFADYSGNDAIGEVTKISKVDGSIINTETVSTRICYRNNLATLTVIKDITAETKAVVLQKQVEENERKLYEAREYDKLKTEFFTNISHELKTPLNIILSSLQLYELLTQNNKSEENEKKIEKLTQSMKRNCYRLLRMINNLIDATRIDTGFYKLYLQNCNIVSVVEDVVMSAAEYVRNKGIDLQFDTDVEEMIIACDPNKIERIVLNLLSNAVKFNKQKGSIFVNLFKENDFVCISVKDNGIGIEKSKLGMVFERFRQIDKSFTRDCEGSGIGLSLVKSLTEMHGGSVEAKSVYGEGSEFIIRLPARKSEDDSQNLDFVQRSIVGDDLGNSEIEKISIEFSDIYFNR